MASYYKKLIEAGSMHGVGGLQGPVVGNPIRTRGGRQKPFKPTLSPEQQQQKEKLDALKVAQDAVPADVANTRSAAANRMAADTTQDKAVDAARAIAQGLKPASASAAAAAKVSFVPGSRAAQAAEGPKLPAETRKAPEPAKDAEGKVPQAPFKAEPYKLGSGGMAIKVVKPAETERVKIHLTGDQRKQVKAGMEAASVAARRAMSGPTSAPVSDKPLSGPVDTKREFEPTVIKHAKGRGWANMDTKISSRPASVPGTSERTRVDSTTGSFTVERPKPGGEAVLSVKKMGAGALKRSARRAHEKDGGGMAEGPAHAARVRHATGPAQVHRAVPGQGSSAPEERRGLKLSKEERQARNRQQENIGFSIFLGQYLTEHRYD